MSQVKKTGCIWLTVVSLLLGSACRTPHTEVLEPAGAIVQIPPAIVFRGKPETGQSVEDANTGQPASLPSAGAPLTASEVTPAQVARAEHQIALQPNDPETLNDAGCIIAAAGDNERGAELLEQAHEHAPDDPTIAYNYARSLYQQGKTEEAVKQAEGALARQSDFDEARLLLASAAIQKQDYNAAEQQVDKLTKRVQQIQQAALTVYGVVQLARGKTDDAKKAFEQALALNGDNAVAHYNLGVAHQKKKDFGQAEKYYRDAVAKDSSLAEAHNNLGTILMQKGDKQAAFEEFHTAAMRNPENKLFANHLSTSARDARESQDEVVGDWVGEGGTFRIWGKISGEFGSMESPMPPGARIKIIKVGDGSYRWEESFDGKSVATTITRLPNGSYQGALVEPPGQRPADVSSDGYATFWVRGDVLMGTTKETATGPNSSINSVRVWKAKRASS